MNASFRQSLLFRMISSVCLAGSNLACRIAFLLIFLAAPARFAYTATLPEPSDGSRTTTGSLNRARSFRTPALPQNGEVLVVDGHNAAASGSWTATSRLIMGRYSHTATLLPNGQVLVAGGTSNGAYMLSSAELYDPANATVLGHPPEVSSKVASFTLRRCCRTARCWLQEVSATLLTISRARKSMIQQAARGRPPAVFARAGSGRQRPYCQVVKSSSQAVTITPILPRGPNSTILRLASGRRPTALGKHDICIQRHCYRMERCLSSAETTSTTAGLSQRRNCPIRRVERGHGPAVSQLHVMITQRFCCPTVRYLLQAVQRG